MCGQAALFFEATAWHSWDVRKTMARFLPQLGVVLLRRRPSAKQQVLCGRALPKVLPIQLACLLGSGELGVFVIVKRVYSQMRRLGRRLADFVLVPCQRRKCSLARSHWWQIAFASPAFVHIRQGPPPRCCGFWPHSGACVTSRSVLLPSNRNGSLRPSRMMLVDLCQEQRRNLPTRRPSDAASGRGWIPSCRVVVRVLCSSVGARCAL